MMFYVHLYFCLFSTNVTNLPKVILILLEKILIHYAYYVKSFYTDTTSQLQGENRSKKMAPFPKCLNVREKPCQDYTQKAWEETGFK